MSDFQKDLKEKWNKLSLFGSKKPKGFKGQGQKLGTADAPKSAVANDRAVRPAAPLSAPRQPPPQRSPPRQPEVPPPGRKLGFSSSDASSSGVIGEGSGSGGIGAGFHSGGGSPARDSPVSPSSSAAAPSAAQAPQSAAAEGAMPGWSLADGAAQHDAGPPSEELQAAAALLHGEPQGVKSAALLSRVLNNIISKPSEEKYRKLRLSNKKVQDELVNVSGGLEFLQAAGFQLVFDEADGYAVFLEDEDIEQLSSALQALDRTFQPQQPQSPAANPPIQWSNAVNVTANDQAAAGDAASAPASQQQTQRQQQHARSAMPAAAAAAEPRDRHTQVLLPDNPATDVSDEVFRRTPAEVKAAYLAARRKQELGQMLMTRETRARLAAGGASKVKAPSHAVIRVRLPDGLVLQGEFNGGEPVSRVFEWVSDSLRDPSRIYELITPARRPLVTSAGTVRQADLLPSSLLNFRWLDHGGPDARLPALRDSLLAEARPSVG